MTRTAVLSDELWARIEPLPPPLKAPMGRPMAPHRRLVEGSICRLRTGVAWRDLPNEFGPWRPVWKRHARFSKDGTWDKVLLALQAQADSRGEIDWNVSVDLGGRPGASAQRDGGEVPAEGHRPHWGPCRRTRCREVAGTNRAITP